MAWHQPGDKLYLNQWWLVYWPIGASLRLSELKELCIWYPLQLMILLNVTIMNKKINHLYNTKFLLDHAHVECLGNNKANLRDLIAATGLVISNWIQIVNFSARVTVKFDGWPWKTIGHLFYATSSFVHHFVAIGEFKLQLQSGNAQSGSNSTIFRAVRPWNLTDDLAKQ